MDKKDDSSRGALATRLHAVLQWVPQKLRELRSFFVEVRAELKKVTWPSRAEVQNTTLVVIGTTIFFGFYLALADYLFAQALTLIVKK